MFHVGFYFTREFILHYFRKDVIPSQIAALLKHSDLNHACEKRAALSLVYTASFKYTAADFAAYKISRSRLMADKHATICWLKTARRYGAVRWEDMIFIYFESVSSLSSITEQCNEHDLNILRPLPLHSKARGEIWLCERWFCLYHLLT